LNQPRHKGSYNLLELEASMEHHHLPAWPEGRWKGADFPSVADTGVEMESWRGGFSGAHQLPAVLLSLGS